MTPRIGMTRRRLPNRRAAVTETIEFTAGDGRAVPFEATIGFDGLGSPKEIFLSGAKAGTDMAAVLADAGVSLSVALQHGVTAEAMAASISRGEAAGMPSSVIGAALDLLARYERGEVAP